MKDRLPDKQIEVWFQDETRFGQKTRLARLWAERGSRPRVTQQNGFLSGYIFGAVNPVSGARVGLVATCCDSYVMQLHINEISLRVAANVHVALVVDGAGWHRANTIALPVNVSLHFLPPYSPELNPIERLWLWLKDHCLSNRQYPDLNAIVDAGVSAWNELCEATVQSVCNANNILPKFYLA